MAIASTISLQTFPHFRTTRVRIVRQREAAECGIACVAMVLSYFGKHVDLRRLRVEGGVSLKGCTLKDLTVLTSNMGLSCRPVKAELWALSNLETPGILHWDMSHFVVLERATSQYLDIVDPAVGRRRLTLDEASKHFTGIAMECRPNAGFVKERSVRRLRWRDIIKGAVGLKRQIAVILLFSLIGGMIGLAAPQYIQYAIDHAVLNQDIGNLTILAIGFALLLLFGVGVSVLQSFSILHVTTTLLFHFRRNLFRHLLFLPTSYFETRSVGDIISRVDSYEDIRDTFTIDAINAVIQGFFALIIGALILLYSWKIFLIILCYIVVSALIALGFFPFLRRRTMDAIVAEATAESKTIEAVRGNQSIKALGMEARALDSWGIAQADAVNAALLPAKLDIWQNAIEGILNIADQIAIPAFALFLVIKGELTLGMFYAVNAYKSQFTSAMDTLVDAAFKFAFNGIHLERLGDIALEEPEQPIPSFESSSVAKEPSSGPLGTIDTIELVSGSFRYAANDDWIFEDLTLKLRKGERVSLIGVSGCGKTTLLKVLSSILKPSEGKLLVNGTRLQACQLREFRRGIGTVMQNDSLFAGSVAFNVSACGEEINRERVAEVCRIAEVHDEIEAMPMQYETLIGDMGSALSTGQQQRIILARALYASPDFLFLDEGTAHLDPEQELRILTNLEDLEIGILFSVHNRQALKFSDRIYRMRDGEITEELD